MTDRQQHLVVPSERNKRMYLRQVVWSATKSGLWNAATMWVVSLGLVLGYASSARAQPTPLHRTAADSAGAFSAVVEKLISDDEEAARAAADPSFNELLVFPRVFVRIAGMPRDAWAQPSVARLRAHRWFYGGRAMDSTRALAQRSAVRGLGLRTTPFPAELSLALDFSSNSDTARVTAYWAWNDCEERRGLLGIFVNRHLVARTPDGWHWVDNAGGGTIDALCR